MKKINKKGFTLVEMAAIIIVIGLVIGVAVPTSMGILNKSKKKAFEVSVEGYLKAIETDNFDRGGASNSYTILNGVVTHDKTNEEIKTKNDTNESGTIVITNKGVVSGTIQRNRFCAYSSVTKKSMQFNFDTDACIQDRGYYIYGLRWDSETNTYTRLENAQGMQANAGVDNQSVRNDFDKAEIYKDMREVTDTYGNKFIEIPKFYIKKNFNGKIKEWYISKEKVDSTYYLPSCFYNFQTNQELPYVWVGKYAGTVNTSNRLQSISNVTVEPKDDYEDYKTFTNNNNVNGLSGYHMLDIHVIDVLQVLFYIEFKTLNSQTIMMGNVDSPYQGTGVTDSITSSSGSIGSNTSGKGSFKYRGIENLYGNIDQYVEGILLNVNTKQIAVCQDSTQYFNKKPGYQPACYKTLSYTTSYGSGNYIEEMGYDSNFPAVQIPTLLNNSKPNLYGDIYNYATTTTTPSIANLFVFGGDNTNKNYAGISKYYITTTGVTSTNTTRLIKKNI